MAHPAAGLRLFFLGGAGILQDGRPLGGPAAHRHRLALLALLAANQKPLTRDKLMAWLWPERDAKSGRKLLKVAVHEIRKILGDASLVTTGDQLSLDAAVIPSDVTTFVEAIADCHLERAAATYGGPFLDGFFLQHASEFDQWVETERARYAAVYANALEQLARAAALRGELSLATTWWRQLTLHSPLRGDVAQELMRALASAGAVDAAIQHADTHAQARYTELELGPDPDIAALARQLASQPRQPAPHEPELAAAPPSMSFVKLPPLTVAPSKRRRSSLGGAVAVGIVAVAIATYAFIRTPAAVAHNAATDNIVAILPADISGADTSLAYLKQGLVDLLSSRFTGEGGPRAMDPRRIAAAATATGALGLNAALDRARQLGAGQLLLSKAVELQGRLELSAILYHVPDGAVLAQARSDVPSIDRLADGVDRLAAELLVRAAKEPEDRVGALVNRGLPALRSYLGAQIAYANGRYPAAETLFARTLDIDSTFGLAGLGLTLANSWNTINENYGRGRDAALRWQSTLSTRDRIFLHAFFGPDPALGPVKSPADLLQAWEDVVEKYPDWAEAWYHLGDRYYHYGGLTGLADPLDRARTAFRHALAIDSTFVAPLHHLIEIYAARGERLEVRATSDRYFHANPTVSRDATAIGWEVATALADTPQLSKIRATFGTMPTSDLARIVWVTLDNGWSSNDAERALVELNRRASVTSEHENASILAFAAALNEGHHDAARAAARSIGAVAPDLPVAAVWDMYAALFGDASVDSALAAASEEKLRAFADARVLSDQVQRASPLTARCLMGMWRVSQADLAGTRKDIEQLHRTIAAVDARAVSTRDATICESLLTAGVAVILKDARASALVARLDTMMLRERVPPRAALEAAAIVASRLHEQLGEMDQALSAARRREHYTGHPIFLSAQLANEARLAALTGDASGARRAYEHYLALRLTPDSGPPTRDTQQARRALARLPTK